MLVMFFRWFIDKIFHRTKNQVRRRTFHLKIISKMRLTFQNVQNNLPIIWVRWAWKVVQKLKHGIVWFFVHQNGLKHGPFFYHKFNHAVYQPNQLLVGRDDHPNWNNKFLLHSENKKDLQNFARVRMGTAVPKELFLPLVSHFSKVFVKMTRFQILRPNFW